MSATFNPLKINGVKKTILVGSGKGGVGKSTIAFNLALALAEKGYKIGIMDADVHGPSIPILMDMHQKPEVSDNKKLIPINRYGLKCISIGFFIDQGMPTIWRGPMIQNTIRQFMNDVDWGEIDYMIVDLPPGTGDVQLSIAQNAIVDGAIIVGISQKLALGDVAKSVNMFKKVNIPILGVVENMSGYQCPICHECSPLFTRGQLDDFSQTQGVEVLSKLPFDPCFNFEEYDNRPAFLQEEANIIKEKFKDLAEKVVEKVSL